MVSNRHLFILAFFFSLGALGKEGFNFSVHYNPIIEKYYPLLEKPSLVVLALENNGLPISQSGKVLIHSPSHFEINRNNPVPFKRLDVRFLSKNLDSYLYDLAFAWPGLITNFNVLIELNISDLKRGTINVLIKKPSVKYIPSWILIRIEQFGQNLLTENIQYKMNQYLVSLDQNVGLEEQILIEAYKKKVTSPKTQIHSNNTQPLTSWFLIISFAVWFIGLPLLIFMWIHLPRKWIDKLLNKTSH